MGFLFLFFYYDMHLLHFDAAYMHFFKPSFSEWPTYIYVCQLVLVCHRLTGITPQCRQQVISQSYYICIVPPKQVSAVQSTSQKTDVEIKAGPGVIKPHKYDAIINLRVSYQKVHLTIIFPFDYNSISILYALIHTNTVLLMVGNEKGKYIM